MAEWLREVDPTGALTEYLGALEEIYDNVDQVIDVYVLPETTHGALDPQFFEDARVTDPEHQLLFVRWFAAEFGAHSSSGSTRSLRHDECGHSVSISNENGSSSGATPPRTPQDWSRVSVEEWLAGIHRTFPPCCGQGIGALNRLRYCGALAAHFSCIRDIEARHAARLDPQGGAAAPLRLDEAFFELVGVTDPDHQESFQAWFAAAAAAPAGVARGDWLWHPELKDQPNLPETDPRGRWAEGTEAKAAEPGEAAEEAGGMEARHPHGLHAVQEPEQEPEQHL